MVYYFVPNYCIQYILRNSKSPRYSKCINLVVFIRLKFILVRRQMGQGIQEWTK